MAAGRGKIRFGTTNSDVRFDEFTFDVRRRDADQISIVLQIPHRDRDKQLLLVLSNDESTYLINQLSAALLEADSK